MTNKRTFEFPGPRPESDYEETAELPVQTEPLVVSTVSDMNLTQVPPVDAGTSIFDYENSAVIEGPHFADAPRYQQLSSYERLLNMLWYEKRRDFLTVIAALGLLVLGVSAFILLLKESPAFETAVEPSDTEESPRSTFLLPPAGPALTSTTAATLPEPTQSKQTKPAPTATTSVVVTNLQDAQSNPEASSDSGLDILLPQVVEQTITSENVDADQATTISSTPSTEEKIESTTVATTVSPAASAITSKKIALDASLTKINFSGNFCASAYTLTLASEERSLDRTVDKSAEDCSKLWPAYFTGLIAGQKYQLTIGAAHKETGKIFYSTTSFIAE